MQEAPELIGGFVLQTGDVEYDYSLTDSSDVCSKEIDRRQKMSTISSQEIISIIKGEIADFDAHAGEIRETGTVIWWVMALPLSMASTMPCTGKS